MAQHNELGTKGEDAAVEFLKALQHEILERNYRHGRAEVDIISKDGRTIVFTEVKTRSTNAFGYPEEFVDKKKRTQMKRAAEEYMYQLKADADIRFDIISINQKNGELIVHHIKDAFFHE
ncbi:MAG TPA: YraN family protein [Chitinophagales bacterium]|nr:YraN family protein [Chitinophagales bacterium]